MSKSRLALMAAMMSSTPTLPYDAEVMYLQGSGTQYIDTGIVGNINTILEISFTFSTNKRYMAGCNLDNSKAITLYVANEDNNQRFGDQTVLCSFTRNTDLVVNTSKDGLVVNNTNYTRTTTTEFSTEGTLHLFHCNGKSNCALGKLYYAKIWDGNVLVRDFVPVRVGQVGYLYDSVSRQLFGNAGSGDFTIGNDVTS